MICKKFIDISRLKNSYMDGFRTGDKIIIQEKIDGANAAIRTDGTDIFVQSRKNILSEENTLRGFYEFTQNFDKSKVIGTLGEDLILYGEWLVPHSVKYPEEKYNKFYAYDVYSLSRGEFLPQNEVKSIAEKIGVPYVPVFFEGDFKDWDSVITFVGKTEMGGEYGEGIVVKNITRLGEMSNTKLPPYVKIVCEKFAETKGHKDSKPVDPEKVKEAERVKSLVATIVTPARIEKLVNKMVDEDIIPYDWGEKDMGTIARNLGRAVYDDCVKEEPDVVAEVGDAFGKVANSLAMGYIKEKLKSR